MRVLAEQRTSPAGRKAIRRPEPRVNERASWPRRLLNVAWAVLGWAPLTPVGLVIAIGLAGLIKWVAIPKQDQLLWTLAASGLAYQAIAVVSVVVTGLWLRFRPQGVAGLPIKGDVGRPFETGYSPGWAAWNPLARVEITWVSAREAVVRLVSRRLNVVEEVTARERFAAGRVERCFVVGDIAHLARVRFVRGRDESITIRPSRGAVTRLNPSAEVVAGDQFGDPDGKPEGELIEMRRYAAGDPLKLVLWKLYARTGRLMVRTPERSVALTEATRAYLVAGPGDEASAGIARGWIESGGLGLGSAFGADGRPGSATTVEDAHARIVHSVGSRVRGGEGLADFFADGDRSGVSGGMLFVPHRPGAWLDRTIAAVGGRRGTIRAFIGVDGLSARSRSNRYLRLLTVRDEHEGADPVEVGAIVSRLVAAGIEVKVMDRVSGRMVRPEAWRQIDSKGGRS